MAIVSIIIVCSRIKIIVSIIINDVVKKIILYFILKIMIFQEINDFSLTILHKNVNT